VVSLPSYRETLREYIRQNALPPDKFSHQERLYALTARLGEGRVYDDEVVYAAVWLHDLGVFIGHRPDDPAGLASWDHVVYVCRRAPELLREFRFPEPKIPHVLQVIRTHQPKDQPESLEATLVRDADILEQLGAVGILRTVSKVGRDTRFIRFSDALKVLRNNLETLPGLLELEISRQLAQERINLLRQFLEAAEQETGPVSW
jgi:uncharacterized protein